MEYNYHLANTREMRALTEAYHICPQCGRRDYKVYVDNRGNPVHETVGRCNREVNCAYHLPPREWFRMHPEEREAWQERTRNAPKREPLKMIVIDKAYLQAAFAKERRQKNTLWNYLNTLPIDKQRLLEQWAMYCTGTAEPYGNTIWWMIDEELRIRSGKIMQYFPNGSRKMDGKSGATTWVHSILGKSGVIDLEKEGYVQCMFGQHLLKLTDAEAVPNVNIVESEKSALIASIYGRADEIWLAVSSITNLNIHNLSPIIRQGRNIMVYPDHDGYQRWKEKTEEIRKQYGKIHCSDYVERAWQPGMKQTADIADIIIHRLKESPEARLERMRRENPEIDNLIDTFGLKPIK